jgi:hypothetical protein
MNPQMRKEMLKQAESIAKTTGRAIKLNDTDKDIVLKKLSSSDSTTTLSKPSSVGAQQVNLEDASELDRLKELSEKPGGLTDIELVEAKAILDKY